MKISAICAFTLFLLAIGQHLPGEDKQLHNFTFNFFDPNGQKLLTLTLPENSAQLQSVSASTPAIDIDLDYRLGGGDNLTFSAKVVCSYSHKKVEVINSQPAESVTRVKVEVPLEGENWTLPYNDKVALADGYLITWTLK